MRAILALICLFWASPNDVAAENFNVAQQLKVERYRAFLYELTFPQTAPDTTAPIDLPEDLKEAIEVWTHS